MALNDRSTYATLRKENDDLQKGFADTQGRLGTLTKQRASLIGTPGTTPIMSGGDTIGSRGGPAKITGYVNAKPGFGLALSSLDKQIADATAERDAFTPKFQSVTKRLTDYTQGVGANALLGGVGAAPIQAPAAAPVATSAPAVRPAVVAAAPAAATAAPATNVLRPGDKNTFTGSDGITRAVQGAEAGAAPGEALVSPMPQLRRPTLASAPQTASIATPGEDERRLEIALSGATFKPARNRGARAQQAALVDGITSRFQQNRQLAAEDNARTLEARTAANIAGINNENENYRAELDQAGRTADRNTEATLRKTELGDIRNRVAQTITDAVGNVSLVRNDGSVTAAKDAGGKQLSAGKAAGLTPSDIYQAYRDDLKAINGNDALTPEARTAQIAEVEARPEYQAVLQSLRGAPATQPPPGAVEKLRGDPKLATEFDAKYGTGAAARYLNN